ncbi:MAG: 3-hydroxyacyl-CoA dehydrogenase NAD-binding domain-containing protein [Candidatus Hodarchaeales archaeon]|jgi:enoyl-CoA hydratase/3-hydroxyacyl-CoA dehydrogenase
MKVDDIKHVAVIGAGDMGHGIAELALMTGYTVSMYDIKEEFVERGKEKIDWSLGKLASKARIGENDQEKFMANLTTTIDIEEAVKNADLIIEAAPEDLELKKKIFADLDKFSPKHAILATNTSNMSVKEIGSATNRPEKVAGLHYFNPPVMMQLIEIVKSENTSDETITVLKDFTKKSTKTPIVSKDSPSFIVNRLTAPASLWLWLMHDRKEHEPAKVDSVALNMGMRMGPYETADFAGLDIIYHSFKYLETRLGKDWTPPASLDQLIQENKLGKKTGQGVYEWPEVGRPEIDTSEQADFDLMDTFKVMVNEAAKILEAGVGTPKDIDTGLKLGMNYPWGPFEVAENADLAELTGFLDGLADKYSNEVFRAHKWIRDGSLMEHAKGEAPAVEEEKSEFEFETIEVKRDTKNFVTTVTLNRPPMNPFNADLVRDLEAVLDRLWDDNDTRCIVIRGSANCFSVGADLSGGIPDSEWILVKYNQIGQRVFRKVREIPKPVIAAIERYALGGGLELAMNCDIRIAKKSARVGNPEVRRGLIAGWSGTQIMARHIGLGKTMEIILTGEMIKAKRAFKMGLINHVVDDDEFEEKVYEMATTIATECSPIAVAISKQLVNQSFESSLDAGVLLEALGQGVTFTTKDLQEGFMAFVQKRKPEFKNE